MIHKRSGEGGDKRYWYWKILSILSLFLFLIELILLQPGFCTDCFIAIGDSRPGRFNEDFQLTKSIIEDAINFTTQDLGNTILAVLMTGDYVKSGSDEDEWDDWVSANTKAFDYLILPCIGNHDDEQNNGFCDYFGWNYYRVFGVTQWYSVDFENVHVVSLDSNLEGYNINSGEGDILEIYQYLWLQNDLEANQKALLKSKSTHSAWTIALCHEPAYGSHTFFGKGHGSNRFMRKRYVTVLEDFNFDLVLSGHNHWYERTVPIRNGKEDPEGIIHVTTGGGGAPLLKVSPFLRDKLKDNNGNSLSEVNKSSYHFCIIEMDDNKNTLKVTAIASITHKVLDEFEIKK